MNTNQLKKFAQEARRKLLEQVGAKLNFVLTTDSAELREKTEQLKQLRLELGRTTKEQLIERVAYTWFNRLMALRFMDANDYQPLGIRIITQKDGYTIPELLDEAKRGNIPDEIKINRQKIYDILDSRIPSKNPQNEAFKELLIAACNHLHVTFPFLFEKINDYTELLLPDDLTSDFSIVKDVRDGMHAEDCKKVEIIGWLYQFYISEKKDEVFASKSKIKKEDIPAATQLFTPRWIVEYMVQNTLGKLWLQNHPKSHLREQMPYFIKSASLEAGDYLKINSPEEIKFLDPASGSGHILVYAFDLFTKIYEEEGYNTSEISQLIIENNLYGFEIDERASQLSALALMMKARDYNRRVFRKELRPNTLCFQDLNVAKDEIKELMKSQQIKVSEELMHDLLLLQQATNFGSLIIPHAHTSEIASVLNKLTQFLPNADVFQRTNVETLIASLKQLELLVYKFHCVVVNPPYMGNGNMNLLLYDFVKSNYPDSKADLMACFIERSLAILRPKGFVGMINQHSWMFLGSYEGLRNKLIDKIHIDTLLHLGSRTFPEISGEIVQNSSFTLFNNQLMREGKYFRLIDFDSSELKRQKTLEAIQHRNCGWLYSSNQNSFIKIPSNPIGYWVNNSLINSFESRLVDDFCDARTGLSSSDNKRFIRIWYEISLNKFSFKTKTEIAKWIPIQRGGGFRKWYGLNLDVINWEKNGIEVKDYAAKLYKSFTRTIKNIPYYFREGISWSYITSGKISLRHFDEGFIILNAGPACFFNDPSNKNYIQALLNSKISESYLSVLSPTLNYDSGPISKIPVIEFDWNSTISEIVENCIAIAKFDWDSKERSWDFKKSDLLSFKVQDIEEAFDLYVRFWRNKFLKLHSQEEKINDIFIHVYQQVGNMTPVIPFEEITIQQDEISRPRLEKLNKRLNRDPKTLKVINYEEVELPFIGSEIISQFISYTVGCMMGRYSIDKDGLILASQTQTFEDYLNEVGKSAPEYTFLPDKDGIIPILEDEWFEDDIVGKFYHFLKVTFGEKNFNKNLAFIEEQIGKDIRKYFLKDFYPDHIKRYKKRPIYWMFSSPKGSFNVLIYMHRYTPDTVSNILNKYLKEFIGKLNTRKEHLEHVQVTGSASDKTKAIKEIDGIVRMLVELHEYERDILYPSATERIEIDLDDGVLVNYNKFGKAVKEVIGLNDPATKKKVRQFDWIDTALIR